MTFSYAMFEIKSTVGHVLDLVDLVDHRVLQQRAATNAQNGHQNHFTRNRWFILGYPQVEYHLSPPRWPEISPVPLPFTNRSQKKPF
jgi:hypothetical protein